MAERPILRIVRLVAALDGFFAFTVAVPSAATLYAIRSGRFNNSNWVEPNAFARTQEWGLILCLFCLIVGFGLWRLKPWSRWGESLLFPPKVYCAYLFLWGYGMSGSWVYLIVPIVVTLNFGAVILLWSRRFRTSFGFGSSATR
jgi:hypothetical protein